MFVLYIRSSTITLNVKISKGVNMSNTDYTVDILINDKPIRKYPFSNKLFVEARKGQEYSIRIKNNSWGRILAVASVDGLDVLTGKSAVENGNGYVINGYNSLTIDGFRISDEEVAKFVFDYKGASYAASKEDGSERNVGVIAARIFQEKVKPQPIVIKEEHHHHYDHWHDYWWNRPWVNPPWHPPTIWCSGLTGQTDVAYGACAGNTTRGDSASWSSLSNAGIDQSMAGDTKHPRGILREYGRNSSQNMSKATGNLGDKVKMMASNCCDADQNVLDAFDMGTKWGEAKESRVVEVEFEKGLLTLSTNIYYASRQSLIEMGVPVGNEKQVSFPEPFQDSKYAKPPKGWTKKY